MAALNQTFYISHGSPTLSIDDSIEARHFLKSWKEKVFSHRPNSILFVSGHYDTTAPTVNVFSGINYTIYDFCGFPDSMYKLKYTAPSTPELAKRVKEVLMATGFKRVDKEQGHGLPWHMGPAYVMYPEADITVCQLSIQSDRNGTYHYNLGKALAPLKEEGIT